MPAVRPKFSAAAAPVERPLPTWIVYPLIFSVVYVAHSRLLRLPFFWDEAGYYIPAALDTFHTGALVPHSTVTNAHPPLPQVLLSLWWRLTGFAISGTRTLVVMVAASALTAVFRLARTLAGTPVAAAVTLLTAAHPVWFAQSTLAHADIFAAAFTLWALALYAERFASPALPLRTFLGVAALFSLAALSKETAVVTPVVLAAWEAVLLLTEHRRRNPLTAATWIVSLLTPVLPLALWYLYHFRQTGFVFGNPEFLRYNATANLQPLRVLLSLWHRVVHLTFHMNLYVPVAAALAALALPRRDGARRLPALGRPAVLALGVVIAGNALAFSVLGGALLTRYLLPLYPLVLLLAVAVWRERLRAWPVLVGLSLAAFGAALFSNPPYSFAPEDNLAYRDFVLLHQQAAAVITARFPQSTVLTAWPATAELQHPELGYVRRPLRTVALDNFTPGEIDKAAAEPGTYDTALVFSTKYVPPPGWFHWQSGRTDARFFDFHRDLAPAAVAQRLGGTVVWQGERNGEWAAVLRFPRSNDAWLQPLPGPVLQHGDGL